MEGDGEERPTPVAYARDGGSVRDDPLAAAARRGRALPARPLHARGAGDAVAPLGGGEAPRPGPALSRDRATDRSLDGDRDAGGTLAAARRGRLPAGSRPEGSQLVDLLKVAVPAKGRLREPAVKLLEDAGLGPEQPGERALAFPCRNAPVEVLLVRAADIPEYVQDGVVDCGITGVDLVRERDAEVTELVRLGFGSCRLEAAVPEESTIESLGQLAGRSVATVYPGLAR